MALKEAFRRSSQSPQCRWPQVTEYALWIPVIAVGNTDVFDKQGQLYREICIKADALADSAFALPSVF
jgi:hypothetical protein